MKISLVLFLILINPINDKIKIVAYPLSQNCLKMSKKRQMMALTRKEPPKEQKKLRMVYPEL